MTQKSTEQDHSSTPSERSLASLLRHSTGSAWPLNVFVAVIGIALSCGVFATLREGHVRSVKSDFAREVLDRARAIEEAFGHGVEMITATGAFVESSPIPSRQQFAEFARTLLQERSTVLAMSWIPRISAGQRARFEREARSDIRGFQVTETSLANEVIPAGDRAEYFPVLYIEPVSGNRRALGYDLASNALRREALERAVATGKVSATARLRLVQEPEEQFSVLLVRAVYRRGAEIDTIERRRANLLGFVTEVVRIGDVVEQALEILEPGGIDLTLFDDTATGDDRFLHFHTSRRRTADSRLEGGSATLNQALHFEAAGRRWLVVGTAAPGLFSTAAPLRAWNALLAGLIFTGLVVAYLLLLRRQEHGLRDDRDRLELRVRERTAELEGVHRSLLAKERLATLGQLAGTVAHEIRNPLSTIDMCMQLLVPEVGGKSADVDRALERARRNIERCGRIITELLDFTRAKGLDLKPTEVDRWLVDLLDEYAFPEGVTVHRQLGAPGAFVEFDTDLLQRAVVNLLDNACQAQAAPGSAEGTAQTATGTISVATRLDDAGLRIEVSDDGPGIPAELLERVFEPLFSTRPFGVGLGLPTVRRTMEEHHGEFRVTTGPGRGTRAVLSLPSRGASP